MRTPPAPSSISRTRASESLLGVARQRHLLAFTDTDTVDACEVFQCPTLTGGIERWTKPTGVLVLGLSGVVLLRAEPRPRYPSTGQSHASRP